MLDILIVGLSVFGVFCLILWKIESGDENSKRVAWLADHPQVQRKRSTRWLNVQ